MISQLDDNGNILSFDPTYLDWVQDKNQAYYNKNKLVRPWGFGELYDSSAISLENPSTFLTSLDPIVRTPGEYTEPSPETGLPTTTPLLRTGECIHPCVRVRIDGGGPGLEEDGSSTEISRFLNAAKKALHLIGVYNPPALKDYTLVQSQAVKTEKGYSGEPSGVIWKNKDGKVLPEDILGQTEIRMLRRQNKLNQKWFSFW